MYNGSEEKEMTTVLWLVLCLNCGDVIITDHVPKGHRMECVECGEVVDVSVKLLRKMPNIGENNESSLIQHRI